MTHQLNNKNNVSYKVCFPKWSLTEFTIKIAIQQTDDQIVMEQCQD